MGTRIFETGATPPVVWFVVFIAQPSHSRLAFSVQFEYERGAAKEFMHFVFESNQNGSGAWIASMQSESLVRQPYID